MDQQEIFLNWIMKDIHEMQLWRKQEEKTQGLWNAE